MASLGKQNNKKRTGSRDKKHTNLLKHDSKPDSSGSKLSDSCITKFLKVFPKNQIDQNELHLNDISQSKKTDMSNGTAQLSYKSPCKRKKAFSKLKGSYSLRSLDSGRVLRSRVSTSKCSTSLNPVSNPGNLVTRSKKRGKKKGKKLNQDELSRIKKHIRYMLNRMNYEQSLIDAYSGEGWKGQSAEKIRPEKELGRAKSEILRCKLKIREIFQQLDSLLADGRIQESLFDPDGIDSENIFCGKCGSKEVSADNDIILCDGVCERGFHQKCLNPPLLSEDIPSGDEGWLCPQCECKLECIDLLSEFLGKDLSIEDSWKKFFPEAAALANGNGLHDDLNLPSDDSEDDDYNPDNQGVDVDEQEEGPGFEVSDSSSSLYDSASSDNNVGQAPNELSTDDSDDGDYDPDAVDPDKEIQKTIPSSDESDFTSDSDEFCAELGKNAHADVTSAPCPQRSEFLIDSGRDNVKNQDNSLEYSKLPSPMLELEKQENGLRSANKRDRERLDYKKLYDEEYGKSSSDSSDDEDWNEMCTPKKLMKTDNEEFEESVIHGAAKSTQKLQNSISSISAAEAHVPQKPHFIGSSSPRFRKKSSVSSKILYEAFQENLYPTKERKESLAQEASMTFQQVTKWFGNARHTFRASSTAHCTDGVRTTTIKDYYKKKMNVVFKENQYPSKEKKEDLARGQGMTPQEILHEAFQENQYPTKEKKENLAQEIGMTFKQVSKWFGNARHNFRAASNRHRATDTIRTTTPEECYKKKLNEVFQENQYPSKKKKEELAQELGMTPQKVSVWFQTARRNSRASAKESGDPMTSSSDKAKAFGRRKLDSDAVDETPGAKINTPQSCTSTSKSRKRIVTKSSEIPTTVAGSEGEKDGVNEEDYRQKAIAKELRRMRSGR